MQIKLEVIVDADFNGVCKDAISFETGVSRASVADPEKYTYEHHGEDFSPIDPGALTCFLEDVILGRPMPTKFVCRTLKVDTVFAMALFLHRDLATHPALPGIVASVDLAHRRGPQGLAHIDFDLADLIQLISGSFPAGTPKTEEASRLSEAVGWVNSFMNQRDAIPTGPGFPLPKVRDVGSNGFVIGELNSGLLVHGWVNLYRYGYLKGILVGPDREGLRVVVGSRKSVYVPFNLVRAASILNEVEQAMGQPPEWRADELWLFSPHRGTRLSIDDLKEVFLRV